MPIMSQKGIIIALAGITLACVLALGFRNFKLGPNRDDNSLQAKDPLPANSVAEFSGWNLNELQIENSSPDAVQRLANILHTILEESQRTSGTISKIESMATTPPGRYMPQRLEVSAIRDKAGVCMNEFKVFEIKSDLELVAAEQMRDCCLWSDKCHDLRSPLDWLYHFSRLPESELPKFWGEQAGEARILGPNWYVWNCDEIFADGQARCQITAPGESVELILEGDGSRASVVSVKYGDE